MNDPIALRLALIQQVCPVEAGSLTTLLEESERRAAGVTAFAVQHFRPTLLPATAWVSPLHAPVATLLPSEAQ